MIDSQLQIVPEATHMQVAQQQPTPMMMLAAAFERGADVAQLERLMEMSERWEANEARKAFVDAMAAFKLDAPEILKDKAVEYKTSKGGTMNYRHATIGHITDKIVAGLAAHGISHAWKPIQNGRKVKVICVLTHRRGHSEPTELEADIDQGYGRNPLQDLCATITYLERYTLLAATGLAPKEMMMADMDGRRDGDDRPVGDVSEPGTVVQRPPDQVWQELCPDGWMECSMPNGGCYGDLLSLENCQKVLGAAWSKHRASPALCAWGASWILARMKERKLEWRDIKDAKRLAELALPDDFWDLKPAQLWAVGVEIRHIIAEDEQLQSQSK